MAEEISNKTLAVIVVAAIVITLGSTALIMRMGAPMITGMAVQQAGTATFNITDTVLIEINDNDIDFGHGSVTAGATNAVIDSEGTNTSWDGTVTADEFELENQGNVAIDIHVNSTDTAAQFIGGSTPLYKWATDLTDVTGPGTCSTYLGGAEDTFVEVVTTDTNTLFCGSLPHTDGGDRVGMDLQLTIPSDATPGVRTATINFVASKA